MLSTAGRWVSGIAVFLASAVGGAVDDGPRVPGGCEGRDGEPPTVLWIGTSLSAGFRVPRDSALTTRIERYSSAAGAEFKLVDVSAPGETLEGARPKLESHADEPICILVVELGANEALRRLPVVSIETGFRMLLESARALWPNARILLISTAPSRYAADGYEREYAAVFRALERERGVVVVDRVLDGLGGNPRLLLYDGLHPNARGHEVIAARIWPRLNDLLELVQGDTVGKARQLQ